MFYCTFCLKMGTYFRNSFELKTAEHKLLRFTIPHLGVDSGDQNCAHMISCKANRHSFHVFLDYHNDETVSCICCPTLCLKMGVFELTSLTRCATFVALHMSHCELCKCKWGSFMTN